MRMWMTDPAGMCRKHLLGEHVELHMFAGSLRKGLNLSGFYSRGLLEPKAIVKRHALLVEEFGRRGFSHGSPLDAEELGGIVAALPKEIRESRVNRANAKKELVRRCPECSAGLSALKIINRE